MKKVGGVSTAAADAFGVPRVGQALPGGQGGSFRHGDAVLKRTDDAAEAEWTAEVLSSLVPQGFRLARPLSASDGRWVVDGWTATEFVVGEPRPEGRWDEVLTAGRAFHAAIAHIGEPAFLSHRKHRWAVADRVAWDGGTVTAGPGVAALLEGLTASRAEVHAPPQLIHGDLAGNVLLAQELPPAIIDFSPYWRPVGYAEAMVAVDGMLWFDGGPALEPLRAQHADFGQLLVRALIFRLVAHSEGSGEAAALDELPQFAAVADRIERLNRGRP